MNREQMVDKAAEAIRTWDDSPNISAEAVLNAILPQVTTVEELEALPDESVIVEEHGLSHQKVAGLWCEAGSEMPGSSRTLLLPATVVWQP